MEVHNMVRKQTVWRHFFSLGLAVIVALTAAGFSQEYNEAPALAEMVAAGELPPVAERIPLEPKLVNELPASLLSYEIGQYGGTLRTAVVSWRLADVFIGTNEPLINTAGLLGEEVTGNVLLGWEANEDQTEFTFFLREGMRWSDGEPVTTEAVRYAWEDVMTNEELTPLPVSWLRSGGSPTGELMTLEIIDDYTFKMTSAEPYGGFINPVLTLEGWNAYEYLLKPAHFLRQFHASYASEEDLARLIEEDGQVDDWIQLHQKRDCPRASNVNAIACMGNPKLHAWLLVSRTQEQAVYERNPYYWKVDAAGNQLPYIDSIVTTNVQDFEALGLKMISGEVDFAREALALNKMPLYRENEANGYIAGVYNMHITPTDVLINWATDDPVWRQVVWDLRFRQALAYAIDREEIIDSVYFGFAEPTSHGINEFDPDRANQLLDEMGLDQRDAAGFRLGPDGETFTMDFVVPNDLWDDLVPVTELVVEFFNDVGIKTTMQAVPDSLVMEQGRANEVEVTVINTQTPIWGMIPKLNWYWQIAPPWVDWWYSGGQTGEEPPEIMKEFFTNLFELYKVPVEEGPALAQEVLDEIGEKVIYILHIENVKQPLIYSQNLGNVPESADAIAIAVNHAWEQLFFRQ